MVALKSRCDDVQVASAWVEGVDLGEKARREVATGKFVQDCPEKRESYMMIDSARKSRTTKKTISLSVSWMR